MAVKNGSKFIKEQIDSILPQLREGDELIISDDTSDDDTLNIINSYQDQRIKILNNTVPGVVSNFENCLSVSKGDHIFLSDQDDVWKPNKIQTMQLYLDKYDLVVSDCILVNEQLSRENDSFFKLNNSGKGVFKNLIRNSYMGCCMAFNKRVLLKVLPFPKRIPMHDVWIGMIAELHFNVVFIPDKLVYYRRHPNNATTTSGGSPYLLYQKLMFRYQIVKSLAKGLYA